MPVGFYGASQEVLNRLLDVVKARWPKLDVRYALSPPFRPLTDEEDATVVRDINSSGTRILFVGLNTPKQDRWMAAHRGRVDAVMIGVGAAFDFLAGTKPQAPRWLMPLGLEWLFRLITEPDASGNATQNTCHDLRFCLRCRYSSGAETHNPYFLKGFSTTLFLTVQ